MLVQKCKNSVFCVYFLFFFFVGTICGVFCYSLQISSDLDFVSYYSVAISESLFDCSLLSFLAAARPFVFVAFLALTSFGHRFLFLLIAVRGFMTAYTAAALWIGNCDLFLIFIRGLVLLPLFYGLCAWSHCRFCNQK